MSTAAASSMTAADRRAPWQVCITHWARSMRRTLLVHRDGARVFAGTFADDPATFEVIESVLAAWREAGLSTAEAAQRTVLLRHFIVGCCIEEQALAELRSDPVDSPKTADPQRFPLTARALPAVLSADAEQRFELGLRLLLSGVTAASADSAVASP